MFLQDEKHEIEKEVERELRVDEKLEQNATKFVAADSDESDDDDDEYEHEMEYEVCFLYIINQLKIYFLLLIKTLHNRMKKVILA